MGKLVGKADPIVAEFNTVRRKKTKSKSQIPRKSLEVILKEVLKRYKKFGYTGYLGHAEIVQAWLEGAA